MSSMAVKWTGESLIYSVEDSVSSSASKVGASNIVSVSPSGILTLSASLDREVADWISFVVSASPRNSPELVVTALVTLQVRCFNELCLYS